MKRPPALRVVGPPSAPSPPFCIDAVTARSPSAEASGPHDHRSCLAPRAGRRGALTGARSRLGDDVHA